MVFVEGDDYRTLRRPGDDPAQFRSVVRPAQVPATPDSVVHQYRGENFTTSTWTDSVGNADMSINGVSASTLNGDRSASSDGVDDVGFADGPQDLPENETFGVALVINSSDQTDATAVIDSKDPSDDQFSIADNDFFDGSTGELIFRLRESGNPLVVETDSVVYDGDTHLICINKNGDDATQINIYVDDMTTATSVSVQNNFDFNSANYVNSAEMGFFANNNLASGAIEGHKDLDATFFEFNSQPYSQQVRLDLKQRVSAIPSVPQRAVTDGLVAWYRFENGTARDWTAFLDDDRFADTTAFDGTVNGASFVQNGGVRDVLTGANSGAYDFDGVDDTVDIPNNALSFLTASGGVTYSTWFETDVIGKQLILDPRAGFNHTLDLLSTGEIRFQVFDGSNVNPATPLPTYSTNSLTHVAATWENNFIELFVNGNSVASASVPNSVTAQRNAQIGENSGNGAQNLDATLDDVRIYNRALSASEINQIYQNTDPDQ
jgi:hypothetical protein